MRSKKSVSIGIPAFNEEHMLESLVQAIMAQNKSNFILTEIVVMCDGCTDKTASIALDLASKHSFIRVIVGKKRRGKLARMYQLYQMCKSDILIMADADTSFANDKVLYEVVKKFMRQDIGLVAARTIPNKSRNLFERIVITSTKLWEEVRHNFNNGTNVYNARGSLMAVSKSVYSELQLPSEVSGTDQYLYFETLRMGYTFAYASRAVVTYSEPNNLKDFLTQHTRYLHANDLMVNIFGVDILKHYAIPMHIKLKAIVVMWMRHPVLLPLAIILQLYLRFMKSKYKENYLTGTWTMIRSSKV